MINPYPKEIEEIMQKLYNCMSEKDGYLYAGVEALKLPHDGVDYISKLFGCSRDSVLLGMKELDEAILRKNTIK